MLPQNFFIFILFYDFYRKAYNKKPVAENNEEKVDLNNNFRTEAESSIKPKEMEKSSLKNFVEKEITTDFLDYGKTISE